MKKQELTENKNLPPALKHGKMFITYTELVEGKKEKLEELLLEHGSLYILSSKVPPIKVTLAEFS